MWAEHWYTKERKWIREISTLYFKKKSWSWRLDLYCEGTFLSVWRYIYMYVCVCVGDGEAGRWVMS